MAKRLGIPPKIVERSVLAQAELQEKLWAAVPPRPGEPLKTWYWRAGFVLRWTPRRVRAFWNGEARRIDHFEIVTLDRRINALKAEERHHKEDSNAIRESMEVGSGRGTGDGRATQQAGDVVAQGCGVVPRQDR